MRLGGRDMLASEGGPGMGERAEVAELADAGVSKSYALIFKLR